MYDAIVNASTNMNSAKLSTLDDAFVRDNYTAPSYKEFNRRGDDSWGV